MSKRGRPKRNITQTERKRKIAEQRRNYEIRNNDARRKRQRISCISVEQREDNNYRQKEITAVKRKEREENLLGCIQNVEDVNISDIGDMVIKCTLCDGLSFRNEVGRSKNSCCHNGKITIKQLNPYPEELHTLLFGDNEESKHYRENIRVYNNAFAFASFNVVNSDVRGRGPYCMRIVGDAKRKATSSLISKDNPRYGQVYIFDDNETVKHRSNHITREALLLQIQSILKHNPYAEHYRKLHDVFEATNEAAVSLNFLTFNNDDKHRYNIPLVNTVAAIIITKDGAIPESVDVRVFPKNEKESSFINVASHHCDPMLFPLLFPSGDHGWSYLMKTANQKNISPLQYYSHRLSIRENEFNPILASGRLTQQYIINAYLIVESQRLKYLRFNQNHLRTECYQGLMDHVRNSAANNSDNVRIGNVLILPSTFAGSPRSMQQLYLDAMTICRKVGRPDLFITMTCNPQWPEIRRYLNSLPSGTSSTDIPHFVCRLFYQKISALLKDLDTVFGGIRAYVYTIEFQKRGLPHMHLLVTLRNKLLTADDVDKFIVAEIPQRESFPSLWYKVTKHMLHGPHSRFTPCYDEHSGSCTKKFPKSFSDATKMNANGFPFYRRRDNRSEMNTYHGKHQGHIVSVNNSMVVPFNPYLLMKYNCHINVEYCASIMGIKYIHKYIHKGHDRARIEIQNANEDASNVYDEIKDFVDSRYLSASESAWRILELPLHGRSHVVERLPVHLPGMNRVLFREGKETEALIKNNFTKLTAYFELNKCDEFANTLIYEDIPLHYRWIVSERIWKRRINSASILSRLVAVSARESELFHLKILLRKISGARSFDDLRMKDGIVYDTFKQAALQFGFITTDDEMKEVLTEAASTLMPKQLRHFFVYILIGCSDVDGLDLWNQFKVQLADDVNENEALNVIKSLLEKENLSLEKFGLPLPNVLNPVSIEYIDVNHHRNLFADMNKSLNVQQKRVFDAIIKAISSENNKNCFYVDGPAGSGKTFLYKTLIHYASSEHKNLMTIAWTGIAAILLPFGKTAHKSFQLPLNLEDASTLYWNDRAKKMFREIDIFIWDEASMIPASALESIDIALKDICKNDRPFGGKLFLLGGDFRQILPVVKRAGKADIIRASIKFSSVWSFFEIHSLHVNMRVEHNATKFSEWLLTIGNGDIETLSIPEEQKSDDLIRDMYERMNPSEFTTQAILTPRNDDVAKMNKRILELLPTETYISEGIDSIQYRGFDKSEQSTDLLYPLEYINSLTPTGFPPQKLHLKIGAIVMLIRNLSVSDGLCNGTRMIVKKVQKRVLTCEILSGDKTGNIVFIPKIKLDSSADNELPFILYRSQFPVRLAFAMTINKSQGQTFNRIGLYIAEQHPLFSHGQLYVALSRCRSFEGIRIQLPVNANDQINNIVYKEIL